MIPALIAAGVVASALLTLAIYAITATRRAGDADTRAARLDEQLKAANANTATQSARADFQEKRANALDAAIAREAAAAVGPVAGSFARLLEAAADARAAHGAGAADVRDASAAGGAADAERSDELLKPGE